MWRVAQKKVLVLFEEKAILATLRVSETVLCKHQISL
jgi:hypothetical protein